MNKKLFKFSLVLCASILMAVSCTKKDDSPTNPELPSIGKLTAEQSGILSLPKSDAQGTETSGAITVSGFSDSFKTAAKAKTDIKYVIKKVEVKSVSATMKAETDVEKLQKAIKEGAFDIKVDSKIEEIKVGFASKSTDNTSAADNAKAIVSAMGENKNASIALTVEAAPAGNTEGKYTSTTFEVRFGIQVSSKD